MIFWMVNHCNALDLLAYRRPGDHLIDLKVGQRYLAVWPKANSTNIPTIPFSS